MGSFLRKRRKELGYSQVTLSKLMGYKNPQYISNAERGLCAIPVKNHKILSKLLMHPFDDIKEMYFEDFKENYDRIVWHGTDCIRNNINSNKEFFNSINSNGFCIQLAKAFRQKKEVIKWKE